MNSVILPEEVDVVSYLVNVIGGIPSSAPFLNPTTYSFNHFFNQVFFIGPNNYCPNIGFSWYICFRGSFNFHK